MYYYVILTFLVFLVCAVKNTESYSKRDHNDYSVNPRRVVCYLWPWAHYRRYDPFEMEDIDPNHCTHLVYAFAKINEFSYKIEMFDPYLESDENWSLHAYKRFNNLRKNNSLLTTLISVGGFYEGSEKYSDMARDPELRKMFVTSVSEFLARWDFDGLYLDWLYPGSRGGDRKVDKIFYIELIKELRAEFDKSGYVLSAAVSSDKAVIDRGYNITEMNKYLDFYAVMSYNYHSYKAWDEELNHGSPLYGRPEEDPIKAHLNVNFSINYWIENGADKNKLVMGMAFYGNAYLINTTTNPKIGDNAVDISPQSWRACEAGVIPYSDYCEMNQNYSSNWVNWVNWTVVYDQHYKAPYAYNKTHFMGYEDLKSIACKTTYIKKMGLSGGMVVWLDIDDFLGHCGEKYPLLRKVFSMLNGNETAKEECAI